MQILVIISQKNDAGKTRLDVNLVVAAELENVPTVFSDLDPQASAKIWHDLRSKDGSVVISAQASRLTEIIEITLSNGAEFVIIDTVPHSESGALAAARTTDLMLIPCRITESWPK